MPDEAYWETLVDPKETLDRLGLDAVTGDVAEFGCGYGTFTLSLARRVRGVVWAFDIDPVMVQRVRARADASCLRNVQPLVRDLAAVGTGRADASMAVVTVFNLLHCEDPACLLGEAARILAPGGVLAVTHWIWDESTPRGPSLAIRPQPAQLRRWAEDAGFAATSDTPVPLPPYHYGWRFHQR
jgi:SAM-dependent methyltransferase